MAISDQEFDQLSNFIGYGNPSGPVWFLGMEQGQSRDGDAEEDLRKRSQLPQVVDLRQTVQIGGHDKYFSGRRTLQPTWRRMCELMLRVERGINHRDSADTDLKRDYQAKSLGSSDGRTFLLDLMPVAKPSSDPSDWHGSGVLPQFGSLHDYTCKVLPHRVNLLTRFIEQHEPCLVVAYGKGFWPYYQQLFPGAQFSEIQNAGGPVQVTRSRTSVILTAQFTSIQYDRSSVRVAALASDILSQCG